MRRRILDRAGQENAERRYVGDLWAGALSVVGLTPALAAEPHAEGGAPDIDGLDVEPDLPQQRTLGDWLETLTEVSVVEPINAQMIKWVSAFLDQGLAGWRMSSRERGFYETWRELAARDLTCRLLGIKDSAKKIRALPDSPEEAVAQSLDRLGIPAERRSEYLSRQFAQLPGWTGFIRWLGENPDYEGQHGRPIDPVHYLAARLFYEVELVESLCRREWGIPGDLPSIASYWRDRRGRVPKTRPARTRNPRQAKRNLICRQAWRLFQLAQCLELTPAEVGSLSSSDLQRLLEWLDSFPDERHGCVWLEAYEDAYREQLIGRLAAHQRSRPAQETGRPRAQLIFCIDARSEPFRRHIEAAGPYETFGYAGFFGAAISYRAFDDEERFALCPVLLKPAYSVREEPRPGRQEPVKTYASGTRWRELGDELFHDLKANPVGSFMLIDAVGLLFSLGLIGKTLVRKPFEIVRGKIRSWFFRSVPTHVPVAPPPAETSSEVDSEQPPRGLTLEQQAAVVGAGLRTIGLTRNFGRFVVACGHGSSSENNPIRSRVQLRGLRRERRRPERPRVRIDGEQSRGAPTPPGGRPRHTGRRLVPGRQAQYRHRQDCVLRLGGSAGRPRRGSPANDRRPRESRRRAGSRALRTAAGRPPAHVARQGRRACARSNRGLVERTAGMGPFEQRGVSDRTADDHLRPRS